MVQKQILKKAKKNHDVNSKGDIQIYKIYLTLRTLPLRVGVFNHIKKNMIY